MGCPGVRQDFPSNRGLAKYGDHTSLFAKPVERLKEHRFGYVEVRFAGDSVKALPSLKVGLRRKVGASQGTKFSTRHPWRIADHQPWPELRPDDTRPVRTEEVGATQRHPRSLELAGLASRGKVRLIDVEPDHPLSGWKSVSGSSHEGAPAAGGFDYGPGYGAHAREDVARPDGEVSRRLEVSELRYGPTLHQITLTKPSTLPAYAMARPYCNRH
jgi:hypothetical protein